MPAFSKTSKNNLESCDERLQDVFNQVIEWFDCTILEGYRGEERQNEIYAAGNSQVKYPDSKHNKIPSLAVDAIPYPIDWEDRERITYFAGFVMAIAKMQGTSIRWGGDWDKDTELKDNNFDDLVHFELED